MEQWTSTLDTKEAAAFATLGVPIKIVSSLHEASGQRVVRFLLGIASDDGQYLTRPLRKRLRSGELEQREPAHPLLTILRAYHNREAILDLANQGKLCQLAAVPGTKVWQYVHSSQGLAGANGNPAVIQTRDLKLVAALGIVGLPLLSIEGHKGNWSFRVAALRSPQVDGIKLMEAWRRDKAELPFSDPFAQAARGLHAREQLRRAVGEEIDLVLVNKPRTTRHVAIRADAAPAAWDTLHRFLS